MWKENEVNMGLYIPRMEVPKDNCEAIQQITITNNWIDGEMKMLAHNSVTNEFIGEVVDVPEPHGRLIDANDVIERIKQRLGIRNINYLLEAEKPIVMSINSSPTVIEAEE